MLTKADIRKQMREEKRMMAPWEKICKSEAVMEELERMPEFQRAEVVLLYWSMDDEVQTHSFVERWYGQKTVLLPCVAGDNLLLRQYKGPASMTPGEQFGILEPTGEVWTDLDAVQLIVVPGVAFDEHNNRMGRGRGFYDRLLKLTPRALKVGVAYTFQVLSEIPVDPFDVPMDAVICD